VVFLSAYLDADVAWAAFASGARAYVVKDASADQLKEAIRGAARGDLYLDPKVASSTLAWATRNSARQMKPILSAAVSRALRLAIDGHTNAEIAHLLGVSVHTVKSQLATAYRRLGVQDRVEAAAAAVKLRLL
jgi:DNA-binding NarL/FixJ family response regulator